MSNSHNDVDIGGMTLGQAKAIAHYQNRCVFIEDKTRVLSSIPPRILPARDVDEKPQDRRFFIPLGPSGLRRVIHQEADEPQEMSDRKY